VRPNVLLIVFDTARADAFEPYGAPPGSSPVVRDLAESGGVMPKMFAPACWTLPSHASMFTGLLPRANGLATLPGGTYEEARPRMEAHRERLLPEVLRRTGYATRGVSTNVWVSETTGFATGFEQFESLNSRRQAKVQDERLRARLSCQLEGLRANVDDGAEEAGRKLRSWFDETDGRPSFWFVNLIECHSPYLPPRPYNDLGVLERLRAADEARRYLTLGSIWRACAGGFDVPDDALERMRRLYAGAVKAVDAWLGDVLEALDRARLLEDTLVIVTSDHGENFGEGGLMGHAYSLDNRLIRVPMVIHGPGEFGSGDVRSLAALPGLIADAVGLEDHPWHDDLPPSGTAVAQFDPPAGPEDERIGEAIDAWGLGPEAVPRITTHLTCATDGRHKLMRRGDREILFDLEADPLELSPLEPAAGDDAVVTNLRSALARSSSAEKTLATAGDAPVISPEERERIEDQMRLLGYL